MGGFRSKTIICATVISAAVLLAAPLARAQERGPLALASASYFFVGGKIDTSVEGSPMVGHMYVEYMIPARRRHPYPIVMVHGGSQTGTNFTGTPDGREGWAQYFVRRGYAVYVVDQVARGRAAYWSPQVYGPVQPSRLNFTEQRFVAPERYQAMAAGASAHAVAGRRQAGRSRLRPVLRLAVSLDRELPEAAGDQPRRAGGAARQDRSGDPAHPFAIGLVQLAGGRRAAEPDQGDGRGRAERPARPRHREHRRARLVQGCRAHQGVRAGRRAARLRSAGARRRRARVRAPG